MIIIKPACDNCSSGNELLIVIVNSMAFLSSDAVYNLDSVNAQRILSHAYKIYLVIDEYN